MILARYLLRNYFWYFIAANTSFVFLHSVIEFFERIGTLQNTTIPILLQFVACNIIPNFFSLFPLGSWIACCFVLKECTDHERWNALQTLGIHPQRVQAVLVAGSIFLFVAGFVGKEYIAPSLALTSQAINARHFKKQNPRAIHQKWFRLNQHTFCYLAQFDMDTHEGANALLLFFNDKYVLTKKIYAYRYTIHSTSNTLHIEDGFCTNPVDSSSTLLHKEDIIVPELCEQLHTLGQPPTFQELVRHLRYRDATRSDIQIRQEFSALLTRTLTPLQPTLLIALTTGVFICTLRSRGTKWMLMLCVYPIFVLVMSILSFFINNGAPPPLQLLPFIIGFGLAAMLHKLAAN